VEAAAESLLLALFVPVKCGVCPFCVFVTAVVVVVVVGVVLACP